MSNESEISPPRRLSALHCVQVARVCCTIVIAIALTVLAGWCLDNVVLKSVLPGAVAMKPNTAIALCFGSLSLLLFTWPTARAKGVQRKLSIALAAAMAAIGAFTLVEYLVGVNLGIDELLFRDHARSASPRYPAGRMAPISAFNFVCVGLALLLMRRPKYIRYAHGLTACAACGSLLAVIGYLFGVEMLYRSGYFSAIAVNTGVAFLVLCIGLWFATSHVGFMRIVTGCGASGILVRRFGIAALVVPLSISWLHLQGDHHGWFEHDFGAALFALINVVTFSVIVWFGAGSLHKSEGKEAVVQERLRRARLELEDRVHDRTLALETALQVNQQIMEYSLDVICIIDGEGRFSTVSAACEKIWGYTPAELVGRRFIELVHPDDHARTNQTAADIVTGHVVRDFENRYLRKDGSTVFMTWSVYWSPDEKRMFCVARDATERKRSEEALRQATEDAERANRAKSEFLANMSHEIRTPMNGILGMTELTLDTNLSNEQREYLGMVKTSAHSLLRVINDILDFSKIEAGKIDLEEVGFGLRETLGTMLKSLGVRADQKGLELVAAFAPDVPDHLIGDPLRLCQILLNLTDNAIKFTARGEIVISVSANVISESETELHLSVADTGIGISPAKRASIFEAFAQADGSTTRNYGGTGLGLTIASGLAEQMGGRIWVESRLEHGTTFHFTVRVRTSESTRAVARPGIPDKLYGLRALIVDDNAINCRILSELLTNWGMHPVALRSAAAGFEELRSAAAAGQPFALVLLDARMPEMDGFAFAELIKGDPSLTSATLMMLSSAMHVGDAIRATGSGVHGVLTKPVMPADLLNAVLAGLNSKAPGMALELQTQAFPVHPNSGSLRILVVEDNTINRAVAAGLLGRQGHTLVQAVNGLEAVEAVAANEFDLVLMDIQMPEMDGFEATARIREMEKTSGRHIPIVAMTAHAMIGDRERCLAAGMDNYISKPLHGQDLQRIVAGIEISPFPTIRVSSDATVHSHAKMLAQCEDDAELMEYLITLFREEGPAVMALLRNTINQGDAAALAAGAHKLLSSLGAFGAKKAIGLVLRLETQAREGDLSQADALVDEIEREIRLMQSILESYSAAAPPLPNDRFSRNSAQLESRLERVGS